MAYLKFFDSPYLLLGLIVPGLIALTVRSQFVTGQRAPRSEALLLYLAVSAIYYAFVLPFVDLILQRDFGSFTLFLNSDLWREPDKWMLVGWFLIVFVGPSLFGLLLGLNIQKNLVRGLLRQWRINLVHTIPTAWDWKFSNLSGEQWVLVTLIDGTRFAGFFGPDSFASSSDLGERDLYIQETYDIDKDNNWSQHNPDGKSGVLIASGMIRSIEFWPFGPQESGNA